MRIRRSDTTIEVDAGRLKARVATWGGSLIDSLSVDGREVARDGRLVCVLQNGPEGAAEETPRREKFSSKVTKVSVEQSGPVRAVLKVEGVHKAANGTRALSEGWHVHPTGSVN